MVLNECLFTLSILRLFCCYCICSSPYNCHNSWGRGLYYTVPRWTPKYSCHNITEYCSLSWGVLAILFPSSFCSSGVIRKGVTYKRYFNVQVRVQFGVVNTDNKCAFNEQWFLLRSSTLLYQFYWALDFGFVCINYHLDNSSSR